MVAGDRVETSVCAERLGLLIVPPAVGAVNALRTPTALPHSLGPEYRIDRWLFG